MMREDVRELFEGFEGCNQKTKIAKTCRILKSRGIGVVSSQNRVGNIIRYISDEAVFITAPSRGEDGISFTIIDRDFYDRWLANGNGSLSFNGKEGGDDYRVIGYSMVGERQKALHRLVLMNAGIDITGLVVDHRFMESRINTLEALRPATDSQNRRNTRFYFSSARVSLPESVKKQVALGVSEEKIYGMLTDYALKEHGEFAYNPLVDFTNTWYAYVLYKMLGICEFDDLKVYNIAYIESYEPDVARYYKNLLTV